ncbi:MAG: lipopolysaccharide heptosyltransferase II [Gammaproteobacteria bacterium]|nr:MAG: lipopolysaccharide heptosyltransferase II [Gammaproteobacteria bacterium]
MAGQSQTGQPILIVGPSWVGDMVMAQTLFSILAKKFPESPVEVLAPAWSEPLLQRMKEVSATVVMPVGHGELSLPAFWQLAQKLRSRRYRAAYILPNSFKSAVIPMLAGIPRRIGWRGEMRFGLLNDIRLLDEQRYPLMVQRFAALAYPAGQSLPQTLPQPCLQVETQRVPELMARFGLDLSRPVLALCPGAEFGPAKRWPESHYQSVAEVMIKRGWQVWIMGSDNDKEVGEAICGRLKASGLISNGHVSTGKGQAQVVNLAGRTELADAIDLLSCASLVITNDSGLMHIAAALSRPLVAIYGSTSPAFTPPLGKQVETLAIPVECGPCFERECPLQHLKCLNELLPELVLAAIDRLAEPLPVLLD